MYSFRYITMVFAVGLVAISASMATSSTATGGIVFDGKKLAVDYSTFLTRHDVVYLAPAAEGYEGFPIGNGDLGAMAWTPPDKFCFQVNKTNTWDDAPEGLFSAWEDNKKPEKSERFTSLRSCGEFRIEPGLPVLDWMYLKQFEGRLSLPDALATWRAEGPLGTAECSAFVAAEPSVIAIHYEDDLSESVPRRVVLGRWGSRVFEHWYTTVTRDLYFGPAPAKSGCEGDEVWVEQSTRSLKFAMAAILVGPDVKSQRMNSREAGYVLDVGKKCAFDVFIAVVTSEEAADPLAEARRRIREAKQLGRARVYENHKQRWAKFWVQSFVKIPDDYLENLWYINAYQVASAARGKYPPHFIGSLWSWNRDLRPWNHYYQWNQQQYTWPLHTSGHADLFLPYAKWKLEGLSKAIYAAKKTHGCDGAFYSDVSNRRGDQGALEEKMVRNTSPTAYTGLDLWRHYEYTLDREYLKTYAYPILREIVRFYTNKLELGNDGKYHLRGALPNESSLSCLCTDTTTDLAGIRKLFPAFIEASRTLGVDEDLRATAEKMVPNLAEFVFTKVSDKAIPWGDVKSGDPLIAFGRLKKTAQPGDPWSVRPYWRPNAAMNYPCSYHAVNAQLTPVFPANLVNLDDADTELFKSCRNAALAFDPIASNGHTPLPICLARLGQGNLLPGVLEEWVDRYQLFSQGLFCYFRRDYREPFEAGHCSNPYSASEHGVLGLTNNVKVQGSHPEERVDLPRRPFAHMGLEAGSILETTINEMLLQSHKGIIHVFPAVPDNWKDCRFTLHAVGAFIVTSERVDNEVAYIAIESLKGSPCLVINPWPNNNSNNSVRVTAVQTGVEVAVANLKGRLSFPTEPGVTYLIERRSRPASSYGKIHLETKRNMNAKTKRNSRIGIPKQF